MASLNKVMLIGNLGKDPEVKYLEGNIARVGFSLATTEYFKDKNGNKVEQTDWHNIVMWRSVAENAIKLLKKGMQIYLEGRIHSRSWTDKDGQKKQITEIVAENFKLLQKREASSNQSNDFSSGTDIDDIGTKGLPF
jgi:single-strand DNA-binding protein